MLANIWNDKKIQISKKKEGEGRGKGERKDSCSMCLWWNFKKTCNRKILKSIKNVLNILLSKNKASSKTTYSV